MRESKHTPGPWRAAVTEVCHRKDEDRMEIACLPHHYCDAIDVFGPTRSGEYTKDELQANARLISAAPDLLEACSCALGWVTGNMDGDADLGDAIDLLREAIAKAEGTTQP